MLDADMIEAKAYRPYLKNDQSGGHVTDIEIAAFLSGPRNPEQDALLRRIGTLILNPQRADADDELSGVNTGRGHQSG
jgi:hypothetical protein